MSELINKDYGDSIERQIEYINELLVQARKKGIQMKQLAEAINVSPSVLSAFYRTVMPTFFNSKMKMSSEEALEYAFSLVNNISQTRFVPFFPNIILALEDVLESSQDANPNEDKKFLDNFIASVLNAQTSIHNICGIYRTYSITSSDFALKCEPMMIVKASAGLIKVSRLSTHNIIQEGFAMVVGNQSLSIYLNEAKYPKYYPLQMQVNIPLCFNPKLYRGVYLAVDSSSHPVARRIILERIGESSKVTDFQLEKACLYLPEDIPEELSPYFDYLREKDDILRVSVIPEPTANINDLLMEKKIKRLYDEL